MKPLKKLVTIATAIATITLSSQNLSADQMPYDGNCEGYADCCEAPCLAPVVVLGAIAIVAVAAVIIQNQSHGHHHHSH